MANKEYTIYRLSNNFIIDFNKLAIADPQLRKYVYILNNRVVCNFSDQKLLIILTKAIMEHIFQFKWDCPQENLCPRIPSRVNYILWLRAQVEGQIKLVLDIGTGATLIYPLIGWKFYKWKFIATQIDKKSYDFSSAIIKNNNLQNEIDLRLVSQQNIKQQYILTNIIKPQEKICLVLCNPPFFEKEDHKLSRMTSQEHHTEDGEYGFFFNLYRESFRFQNIRSFSCLIGRSTNFNDIRKFLIQEDTLGLLKTLRFGQIQQGKNIRFLVLWQINHQC